MNYDLSVMSMSVMGVQKMSLDRGGVGGWGELYPVLCVDFFNFAKPLTVHVILLRLLAVSASWPTCVLATCT